MPIKAILYRGPDEDHYEICRAQNESNPLISKIIEVKDRTYSAFFEAMKAYPDSVNIISNLDIFFDESIAQVKEIRANECYALSPWDYKNGKAKLRNRNDSQDVWIFLGVPKNIDGGVMMGTPGCDNVMAYNIKQAGYKISNPAKRIRAIHVHETEIRTYKDKDRLNEKDGYRYHFLPVI